MPENCNECKWTKMCNAAHYGSLGCKHRDEITKKGREREHEKKD